MYCNTAFLAVALLAGLQLVHADDGRGLQRGGNAKEVSISGVSSGAAMAVQYAVAHSATVVGVGSIAGPGWGCADGRIAEAINNCLCGRQPVASRIDAARALATGKGGDIDPLDAGMPRALKRAWVFHSPGDGTVAKQSAEAGIDFLAGFIGSAPVVDRGSAADGSHVAAHGMISPDGRDECTATGGSLTYVRQCGAEDNAGKMFLALHGQGGTYDVRKRTANIAEDELWRFDQQALIDAVTKHAGAVAPDQLSAPFPRASGRRKNFDMAKTGYLYVPPSCRASGSQCRIHIALHGCRQDVRTFAATSGYNNWAEHYRTIVIYPAIEPGASQSEELCRMPPVQPVANWWWIEPNVNGCWDWWGYLDKGWPDTKRYLTRRAPQMQVIERIIAEAAKPVR